MFWSVYHWIGFRCVEMVFCHVIGERNLEESECNLKHNGVEFA